MGVQKLDQPKLSYDIGAAAIHWVSAALVVAIIILGFFADPLEDALGIRAMPWHKSLGLTVFAITALRLFWRFTHRPPPLSATMTALQMRGAHMVHGLFYLLLLGLPLSGYLFGSGGPRPMQWFGIDIPKAPIGTPLADVLHEAHEVGGYMIAALLITHVLAAIWHQLVLRDRLIQRMWPGA